MSSRWTGFFVWALVAVCTAFWGMKIFAATRPVPPGTQTPPVAVAADGPMDRLFGAAPVVETQEVAPPADSERFQLVGVIAPRPGASMHNAMAIVTVDQQPAKAWHVGARVDGQTTLLSVERRTAAFGPAGGPASFTLELPEPAAPETGTLAAAVSQPEQGSQAPQTAQQMMQNPRFGNTVPGAVRGAAPGNFPNRAGGMPMRPGVAQPGMVSPNAVPPGRTPPSPAAQNQLVPPNEGQVQPDEE